MKFAAGFAAFVLATSVEAQYGQRSYGAPQKSYAAPQRSYAAPQRSYAAPQKSYGAPQQYRAPQRSYAAPKQYRAPQRSYNRSPYASQQRSYVNRNRYAPQSQSYGSRPASYGYGSRGGYGQSRGYDVDDYSRPSQKTYGEYGIGRQAEPKLSGYYASGDRKPVGPRGEMRAHRSLNIKPSTD